jgi:hypothetical protein
MVFPVVEPDSISPPVNVLVRPVAGKVTLPWQIRTEDPASVTLPLAGPAMVSALQRLVAFTVEV